MILHIYSDASYVPEQEALIREGGYFLRTKIQHTNTINDHEKRTSTFRIQQNDKCHGIGMEAELEGLFENCQKVTSMQTALSEMGHS